MEYVLNEFSLKGQFEDTDEFVDSLYENTLPVLKKLDQNKINLLKSYNIYGSMITSEKSLQVILQDRSYSEIRAVKSLLVKLFLDDPYWDNESKCIVESKYECEFTEETNDHCIAEALERDTSLVSFEHNKFKCSEIEVKKDGLVNNVSNIYDKESMLLRLLNSKFINYNEFLCNKYDNVITFCIINSKDYFEEFISENSLSDDDVKSIIKVIEGFMYKYNNGLDLGHLSKTIEDYYEFRTSLSNNRQIRIFYIMEGRNFIFLNCLLKQQQTTPEHAKAKARNLIKEYKSN